MCSKRPFRPWKLLEGPRALGKLWRRKLELYEGSVKERWRRPHGARQDRASLFACDEQPVSAAQGQARIRNIGCCGVDVVPEESRAPAGVLSDGREGCRKPRPAWIRQPYVAVSCRHGELVPRPNRRVARRVGDV